MWLLLRPQLRLLRPLLLLLQLAIAANRSATALMVLLMMVSRI